MEILQGLFFGLISGLAEFFPVSALAHQKLYALFTGTQITPLLQLFSHGGCFVAVLVFCRKQLKHMQRELRIAGAKKHRRQRQPDMAAVSDARMLWAAAVPIVAGLLLRRIASAAFDQLWMMSLLLMGSGIMLYVIQYVPGGNKSSLSMTPLDGVLYGLCSALAVVPGLSRVGMVLFAGHMRKFDRSYMAELGILLSIPWLLGMLVLDCFALFGALSTLSLLSWIGAILSTAASFGATWASITLLRYLAVRIGFHGFAYYSWGIGLVCFILYLMI